MRWLISVPSGTDLAALREVMRLASGTLRDVEPVPQGAEDVVVFAEGPPDLPRRLDPGDVDVRGIYPDSDPEPY